ncbi:ABC transporter ATP-binding protein [Brooklawnia propionicigenes]|uniref:ABC transporter ATP-binding protein n=1 Tax=Brooklawnia propionicigenes TaxID=3041175 RepID=A0AAN0KB82_9ACTN|nr:ABC transporter ATP-binding protein [Brooklawnia sp. SH051]BEH01835.1 ABC transporter ATP-binding protein [Brooklawnia sp. SH051]
MLAAHSVTRTFRGGAGVRAVDLGVRSGEIHALVGLNGAGKTTLMKLLLGMLRPTEGEVRLDGTPLPALPASAWARVGHVIEHPLAYGDLTARENLLLSARLHGLAATGAAAAVDEALEELRLARYAGVRARRLSAGNRQRVGLAAALQHQPRLLVLDEPTSTLDPGGVILLRDALRRRARDGAAILISSHHLDEVARIADRITLINGGAVIGELDPGGADLERTFFARILADDRRREGA